jgi:uncharacterized protein
VFLDFFLLLRTHGLPVSLTEYLTLLEALQRGLSGYKTEKFYQLSRTVLVKDEKFLDRFDQLFSHYFRGMESIPDPLVSSIPEEWLRKQWELNLTDEEKRMIEAMGGLDKLMERFRQLLEEQKERHEGGSRWIGTGGTSPFGANGYNPMGIRMGQAGSRNRTATKVWDKREFANYDDDLELNTRSFKVALRRLRHFTREGVQEEFDIDRTIEGTSRNAGILDIHMRPERRNRIKLLVLMDVGGSMDDHIRITSELFSAMRHQFKRLEFFYFHNCVYEHLWRDNSRRFSDRTPTLEVLHKYGRDFKIILVGDAAMSPYEITFEGGSVEHHNEEAGLVWLHRLRKQYPALAWLNPTPEESWPYFKSTTIIKDTFDGRMYPLTVGGLVKATRELMRSNKNQARAASR